MYPASPGNPPPNVHVYALTQDVHALTQESGSILPNTPLNLK